MRNPKKDLTFQIRRSISPLPPVATGSRDPLPFVERHKRRRLGGGGVNKRNNIQKKSRVTQKIHWDIINELPCLRAHAPGRLPPRDTLGARRPQPQLGEYWLTRLGGGG